MLLTLTVTGPSATDLGYLLHKHPDRCQSFELSLGHAHVFYPEASADRCTAALLMDVDPVGLVRRQRGSGGDGFLLEQYVNDRPYVACSMMSTAMAHVFGTAMAGRCEKRPDLPGRRWQATLRLAVMPCRGGEVLLRRLFEPLGYTVTAERHALDDRFPEWGGSPYYTVTLTAETKVRELLAHLYVLIPVLDDDKHYWVARDEVDKLLAKGEGWLENHPEKELIVRRYLRHQRFLTGRALAQLTAEETPDVEEEQAQHEREEEQVEAPLRLHEQRIEAVAAEVIAAGATSVVDLGCGEGKLLRRLAKEKSLTRLLGMDVSMRALQIAAERLQLDRQPERQRDRVSLVQGSLMYRDARLAGFDAATVVEVIEHLDPPRLAAFERVVFEHARPGVVIVTTPNAEYNVLFEGLPAGRFRHKDHRFEWTRAEFEAWVQCVGERYGYTPRFAAVGPVHEQYGAPTQMGVLRARNCTHLGRDRNLRGSELQQKVM